MISPLPWTLDESDPSIIRDSENEIIAKDYRFLDLDDFEAICGLITNGTREAKTLSSKEVNTMYELMNGLPEPLKNK